MTDTQREAHERLLQSLTVIGNATLYLGDCLEIFP